MNGPVTKTWKFWPRGLGTRLFLAFLGIAAFTLVAAGTALLTFRDVGARLSIVHTRLAPVVSSVDISRRTERIIARAPALVATTDPESAARIDTQLQAEVNALIDLIEGFAGFRTSAAADIVRSLSASLAELNIRVRNRLAAAGELDDLRLELFAINSDIERLMNPWTEITDAELDAWLRNPEREPASAAAEIIAEQREIRAVQAELSEVVDRLAEAILTDDKRRLEVLGFQAQRAIGRTEVLAFDLDPKLASQLIGITKNLTDLTLGPNAIPDLRRQVIQVNEEAEALVARARSLSLDLTVEVEALGRNATNDIESAVGDAQSVQQRSRVILLSVAALSLAASVLIVWFYVGNNLVRRLTQLSRTTRDIAAGRLDHSASTLGQDEIGGMARAVEVLRHTTIERDRLLAERVDAAAKLEKQVADRTADLEQANLFKARFLASASHDLRQPLHALNLFADQLKDAADPTDRAHLEDRIATAATTLTTLFDSLLDMSKLEAGTLVCAPAPTPMQDLLRRVQATYADSAKAKGLSFRIVSSSMWVCSDVALLERILMNLVGNAVRLTETGGILVGCRSFQDKVRIDVYDSGPGIDPDAQDKIFEEFVQLAAAPGSDNFGLGLSIVNRLAQLLGHTVDLQSVPGRGSRFSVTVPRASPRTTTAQDQPAAESIDRLQGSTILVIDDDPLARESLESLLRTWGCVTRTVSGTSQAEVLQQGHGIDLIISDYNLVKGWTGVDAVEALRSLADQSVPAIILSGETGTEPATAALNQGLPILLKPAAPASLRALVSRLLAHPN